MVAIGAEGAGVSTDAWGDRGIEKSGDIRSLPGADMGPGRRADKVGRLETVTTMLIHKFCCEHAALDVCPIPFEATGINNPITFHEDQMKPDI